MTFGIGNAGTIGGFTLGGTNFRILDGTVTPDWEDGNVKQWSGGRWNKRFVPGKDKLRNISWSGFVETDEIKASLDTFRDNGQYAYTDNVHTLTLVVVLNVRFEHRYSRGQGRRMWFVEIEMEEFSQ